MLEGVELFPKGLISAIDSWQRSSKDKARKARRLREWACDLPQEFRKCPHIVFRQMRLNTSLGLGLAYDAIIESVSSWTTSLEVAQRFREHDQDRSKLLVMFARHPETADVILNLNVVYSHPEFMRAVRATEARFKVKFLGIERWAGTQCEVVLKETVLRRDSIVSLGTYRQLSDAIPFVGRREAGAPSDGEIFHELTGRHINEHFWTSADSAEIGVRSVAAEIQKFLGMRRMWPTSSLLFDKAPLPKVASDQQPIKSYDSPWLG